MNSVAIPEFEEHPSFNLLTSIWIVPLIALIVSGWLVYRHYADLGSEIRIDFAHSGNLVAGESVIRFRNVPIGKVIRIELQDGGEGVTVVARMSREAEPYLNHSSHFWIVSPQIDYSGVRGLDTLINGAYIAMSVPRKGKLVTHFKGKEKPYRGLEEGRYFHLHMANATNIHVGAPVYYHHLRAGGIEKITLSKGGDKTDMTVFIDKKFVTLINMTTKFWHQDLMTLRMDGGEMTMDVAPLTTLLLGGISFASQLDKPYPAPEPEHRFYLYEKRSLAMQKKIGAVDEQWQTFAFEFKGETGSLAKGAPIRHQGFKVGSVTKVDIAYSSRVRSMTARVLGDVDLSMFEDREHNGSVNLSSAVESGLQAELKNSNPFMESVYIDLAYPPEVNATGKPMRVVRDGYTVFPTKDGGAHALLFRLDHLLTSWTQLADANRQPLHNLLEKLKKSADHLDSFMGKSGDLNKALDELRTTLNTSKKVMRGYSSGSLFGKKLEAMIREVGRTSEETKRLMEKLNKKPNALIFGD